MIATTAPMEVQLPPLPIRRLVPATANQPNQGSLLIVATCVPADIRHPTNLSLLNEARELTETLIDTMHLQVRDSFGPG